MDLHTANLTIAVALGAGVLAQALARVVRLPAIVLLLALGVALGPVGLGWVRPESLGEGLFALVDFGVAIILFEGGLNLQWARLRQQERTIRYLITVGAVVTLAGAGLATHHLLGWNWRMALLFGSLVVVTGPTVVTPLLRDLRLQPRIKTILEGEGVLIDPVGVILAALVLQLALASDQTAAATAGLIAGLKSFGFGLAAGAAGGLVFSQILRWRWLVPHGFENILTLGFVLLMFHASDHFVPQSGILAVTVAGVVMGARPSHMDREIREFKDQLTLLVVALLFVLLSADISIEDIRALGRPGFIVVGVLILVVRPIGVWLSTLGSDLGGRERFFIAWLAPRGIVAAAVSSLTADSMTRDGMEGGDAIRGMVFLTIAITVVLAGLTARPMASLLRLRLPARNRMAILGAHDLALRLGRLLREAGVPVSFLDSDPLRCRKAELEGFPVVFGDALEEQTMTRAQFDMVETVIGFTANEHLNFLFAKHARDFFRVPRAMVALSLDRHERKPQHVEKMDVMALFEGPHDVDRWEVWSRHNAVEEQWFRFDPPKGSPAKSGGGETPAEVAESETTVLRDGRRPSELSLILMARRGGTVQPMARRWKWRRGDLACALLHKPEAEKARLALVGQGFVACDPPPPPGVKGKGTAPAPGPKPGTPGPAEPPSPA